MGDLKCTICEGPRDEGSALCWECTEFISDSEFKRGVLFGCFAMSKQSEEEPTRAWVFRFAKKLVG